MPHTPLHRIQVRYLGKVQGVGFRATLQQLAIAKHVVGWVQNEHDGSVTAQLQSDEQTLNNILDDINKAMANNIENQHTTHITPIPDETTLNVR